jgi:hypothetical protein
MLTSLKRVKDIYLLSLADKLSHDAAHVLLHEIGWCLLLGGRWHGVLHDQDWVLQDVSMCLLRDRPAHHVWQWQSGTATAGAFAAVQPDSAALALTLLAVLPAASRANIKQSSSTAVQCRCQ